jgi:O-antigen ligase
LELTLISSIPQHSRTSWQPAFYMALVYIFATYTRLPEFVPRVAGHSLRLGLILTVLAVLGILLSGSLYRIFSSKIVLALTAFTGWLFLCTPFSVWRGGSAGQVVLWCLSVVGLILLAGCIEGAEQCRKAGYALAVSVLAIEVLSFFLGSTDSALDTGRLAFVVGTFSNSNDFAALLLMGLPFCLLVVRTRKGLSVLKGACILGLFLIPLSVVRTGSRGGLLALVIMFILFFFSVPPLQRVPLAIMALLLAVAAAVFAGSGALDRYKTIFRSGDTVYYANETEKSAALSTLSRKELFMSSLRLTIQHPLLGVGPGMFPIADAKDAGERKHPASWHQTHNTYTQISCENGLPALLFYSMALFFCFKATRIVRLGAAAHPELRPYGDMAFSLRLSLIAFTVTAIFASNAYSFYFPLLAGLCAALERSVSSDMKAPKTRQDVHPQPPPPPRQRVGYPPAGPRRAMPAPANYWQ